MKQYRVRQGKTQESGRVEINNDFFGEVQYADAITIKSSAYCLIKACAAGVSDDGQYVTFADRALTMSVGFDFIDLAAGQEVVPA
jgi:hypothetical protein